MKRNRLWISQSANDVAEHHSKRVYPHTHQLLPKLHSHHHKVQDDEEEEDDDDNEMEKGLMNGRMDMQLDIDSVAKEDFCNIFL